MAEFNFCYTASPTMKKLHRSTARIRCAMGPVGSGKSVACIAGETMRRAMAQDPDADGIRKSRVAFIRNTYQELEQTTLKTFKEWFGFVICRYRQKPMEAYIDFPMSDGTRVQCEVLFLAMDKPEDEGKIRSLELTWGYINEGSEIAWPVFDALNERVGRYPKQTKDVNGVVLTKPRCVGIIIDTNAPDDEHWIYQKFEVERPDGYEIFHQPPAVLLKPGSTPENPVWEPNKGQQHGIPPAENIEHLPIGWDYYMNMIPGKDYEKIRVMLQGEYGTVAYGRPVYPNYKDQVFYLPNRKDGEGNPKDTVVMRGLPLLIGVDFGMRFSAAVFAQLTPLRQLRVLEDILLQDASTPEMANVIKAKLANEYREMKVICRGDPAGMQRGRTDGRHDVDIMNEMGIPTLPCITNSPRERIDAVKYFMGQLVDGEPGLVLGSKCPHLRKGFAGRYYFKKISTSGKDELFKTEPFKNEFSHPHDALQYIAASLLIDSNTREAALSAQHIFGGNIQPQRVGVPSAIDSSGLY